MTGALRRRRNSPALFLVRPAESAKTIAPTIFVWLSARARWPELMGIPVDVIFGSVSCLAVLGLVVDWWMTRFTLDTAGVSYERGLFVRRSTSIRWADVVSVQVSRSVACRALGCARVLVGIGSETKGSLLIEAVSEALARETEMRFAASRAAVDDGACGADEGIADVDDGSSEAAPIRSRMSADDGLIYQIRLRDYLVVSVTYGQFVLVVPLVFGVYDNVSGLVSPSSFLSVFPADRASLRMLAIAVPVAAVVVSIGFGIAVAWLRYRSFEVRFREGVFAVSGGLVSAESRQVPRSQVAGIKIHQNPLMRIMGYGRMGFVLRQSGERIGANVLFPAAELARIRDGVRIYFPEHDAAWELPCRVGRRFGSGIFGVAAILLFLAGLAVQGQPVRTMVTLLLALAIVLVVAVNHVWAAAELDPKGDVICFRRGFAWVTYYLVPYSTIYFIESYQDPLSRLVSASTLCLGIYDTRAVRLWVPFARPALVEGLSDKVVEALFTDEERVA